MQILLSRVHARPVHGKCSAALHFVFTCHCHHMLLQNPCCKISAAAWQKHVSFSTAEHPSLQTSVQRVCNSKLCYGLPITPCTCMLQELFLRSPCPTAALQMRKDLQHWPQALSLANQLDPTQIAPLACNYAQVSSVCIYTKRHPACLQHSSSSTAWVGPWQLAC